MALRRLYRDPTVVVSARMTEACRRQLDYLVVTTGAPSVSHYLRVMVEEHLQAAGFQLVDGITATLPRPRPSADEVAAWQENQPDT